ncbi:hypothetical protein [Parasphingorhabdus sp.]|uniref:hypothetical protein n=1 Tax=Parasphingorhabdus sp. TaxID=2709688 RepID=UPI003263B513
MTYMILLVAHIAVLGYWMGSELCINSLYRFVCFRDDLEFAARDAINDHLMDIDQHVRYALALQFLLGTILALEAGYIPTGTAGQIAVLCFGILWLILIEAGHRLRKQKSGQILAKIDRVFRYMIAVAMLAGISGLIINVPLWLSLKMACFAGVILCGVAIRFVLIRHFACWTAMETNGPDDENNRQVQRIYWRATSILGVLWIFIAMIVFLAVFKPQ